MSVQYFLYVILVISIAIHETNSQQHDRSNRQLRGFVKVHSTVSLPSELKNLAEVSSPMKAMDIPVYWHILKSGGTTMKHVFGQCLNLVIGDDHKGEEHNLNIVWEEGKQYVNVDTSTPEGISKARSLNLAQSGMVDVIITPHVYETAEIFDFAHKGRMFSMIRHPVERAVSLFYYLQKATWEPSYDPQLQHMTIEDYVTSPKIEENWMTRFLVNKKSAPLGPTDLQMAKEILRSKFYIGLLSRKEESLKRFITTFGWKVDTPQKEQCINNLLKTGVNRHDHPTISRDSKVWEYLVSHNKYDMELYMYAVQLFEEQAHEVRLHQVINF